MQPSPRARTRLVVTVTPATREERSHAASPSRPASILTKGKPIFGCSRSYLGTMVNRRPTQWSRGQPPERDVRAS